jgi:hypothetical protein
MVTISVGASVAGVRGRVGGDLASPGERRTDDACAAQDSATESLSQGLARHQASTLDQDGPLDRLAQQPSPLDKFSKTQ